MIRFACENCGYKINVHQENAGRRGKCPKCQSPLIIPEKSNTIEIKCENCRQKISVPRKYSGRKGRCPNCKKPIAIPGSEEPVYKPKKEKPEAVAARFMGDDVGLTLLEIPKELKLQEPPVEQEESTRNDIEQEFDEEPEETEFAYERRLPWPIDIFLYPICRSGLSILGIVILTRWFFKLLVLLFGALTGVFAPILVFFGLAFFVNILVRIILVLYFFWYFCECIRESAEGNVRAPETMSRTPGLGEMLWLVLRTIVLFMIFLVPALIYYKSARQVDVLFVTLAGISALFLPMSFLAFVMFNSFTCLNPVLLVSSILRTFLLYSFIIILFLGAIFLVVLISFSKSWSGSMGVEFVCHCLGLYLLLVIAHLIGRFYWRYEEKLNWEC